MATARGAPALKCEACRNDRQRCVSTNPQWPDRCDRCIQTGRPCGPKLPPRYREVRTAASGLLQNPTVERPSRHSPDRTEGRVVLRCLHILTDITWDDVGYPNFNKTGEPAVPIEQWYQAVILGYLHGKYSAANMVVYRIWERQNYIQKHREFVHQRDELLTQHSADEAERQVKEQFVQTYLQKLGDGSDSSDNPTERQVRIAFDHILHRGSRWNDLIQSVGSGELLLVDQTKYVGSLSLTIGDTIEIGTDEEFAELKKFLCLPQNGTRDSCFRLTGLSTCIFDLAGAPKESELRSYLLKTVQARIRAEYGPPIVVTNDPPSDEIKFFNGRPQRDIVAIFGLVIHLSDSPPAVGTSSGPTPPSHYAALSPASDIWNRVTGSDVDMW